jgi:hypothetical protein
MKGSTFKHMLSCAILRQCEEECGNTLPVDAELSPATVQGEKMPFVISARFEITLRSFYTI